MTRATLSVFSKIVLLAAALLFAAAVFFPIWRIELTAPQYPEGLVLQLHADKIGGDVEIINGLNHYIGMKTLHTENFVEFAVLPYVLIGFALITLVVLWRAKPRMLRILTISFIVFGILAALDFYRWNYQYGHDLDPNAAIRVPGMAYQPPMLGYKQLLNFGAYSIPDIGGWMLIAAMVLLLVAFVIETPQLMKLRKRNTALPLLLLLLTVSCANYDAQPITVNKDNCSYCKMGISDTRFAAEAISKKGRVYKFDDIHCMIAFTKEQTQDLAALYVQDYLTGRSFIPVEQAVFLKGGDIRSPMNGGTIAFATDKDARKMIPETRATLVSWRQLLSQ